jgi:seryl-tRNA synthetase
VCKCVSLLSMTRGNRIVAIDAGSLEADRDEFLLTEQAETPAIQEPAWAEDWEEVSAPSPWRHMAPPATAALAIISWTALFVWSNRASFAASPQLDQWIGWISTWSGPVLLVGVIWLLVMRTSRREAGRFGNAARQLGEESDHLASRLTSVNGELSMAREFIAAQARDLDALGRVAVDRLSQNASQLQALILTNSEQIEAIAAVSTAALDNMDKLRGQLPVIANSARDVTNNIASAGRTAHGQLHEMIGGFKRLNDFGQASERQVELLRKAVLEALSELHAGSDHIEQLATKRFAGIAEQGVKFRGELTDYEVKAFATLNAQSEALANAIIKAQTGLSESESDRLAALHSQIDLLMAESATLTNRLKSNEDAALDGLAERLTQFDEAVSSRHSGQQDQVRAIAKHSDALMGQISSLEVRLGEIVAHAEHAEERLTNSVQQLSDRIDESRAALTGADAEIAGLTDSSVRLLELIQAGSQHSREHIPAAMADAEERLHAVEVRVDAMRNKTHEVAELGERLHGAMRNSQQHIESSASGLEALHDRLGQQAIDHGTALDSLHQSLETIQSKSVSLATQIESELKTAIERTLLDHSAAIADPIEQASQRATELAREATIQLRDQLARVDELTGNLESRVSRAREQAEEKIENDFVRRVALITESLNSNAIDIARALDSEVSDTSWAAYLKGDRGIFTRRAVSLVEAGEAKAIVQVYENDTSFHDQVNRYIHDFESMLRQVLSTRDGNTLGVTLLSSDMGKLYVVLAQAIERLRR